MNLKRSGGSQISINLSVDIDGVGEWRDHGIAGLELDILANVALLEEPREVDVHTSVASEDEAVVPIRRRQESPTIACDGVGTMARVGYSAGSGSAHRQ